MKGKNRRILYVALILLPLMMPQVLRTAADQSPSALTGALGDPLGSFQSPGPPAPLNWTGDGQRILNPSFETGTLSPWAKVQSNAAQGSGALLDSVGFEGTSSVSMTVVSGNATSDSYVSMINDLSSQAVGFSSSLRLRAAVFVTSITGTSPSDRVEVSITLATSTGLLRTLHYFFGGGVPANSTSDSYFRITGPPGQWVSIDRNVATDVLSRFSADFSSLSSVQDVRLGVYSKTNGTDPKIKYYDANSNFSWDVNEPVVYDGNSDRTYELLSDKILDGPPPGTVLQTDSKIKFVDTDVNGVRGVTEPVFYDANNNNTADLTDLLIAGRRQVALQPLSVDPKLKYVDSNNNGVWNVDESVVYDSNSNNVYDAGEPIVDGPQADVSILQDDQRIRFVDTNNNGVFNAGEPIVFDTNNNRVYDAGEPLIGGPAPSVGTRFYQTSSTRFDRVELYSATGNFEWIRNNGFETGSLLGWGASQGGVTLPFQATRIRALSGSYSANGTISGSSIDMAQSLDSEPRIEQWSRFKASAYITSLGTTSQDFVDVWLGLVDNSSEANPAFIHFLRTGSGTLPSDTPGTLYRPLSVSGTLNQWLNISSVLQGETSSFSTTIYTPPFHVLVVGVRLSAQAGSRTTAFFDEFSFFGPYHPGPYTSGSAPSYRYATDAANSTYVYPADIPHGAFFLLVPSGQTILNITSPEGLALLRTEYTTSISSGIRRIDVPFTTSFRHAPTGTWRVFTTSSNAVATVYSEDPVTRAVSADFGPGSTANFVSQSKDPFATPIAGAEATLTLWTSTGTNVGTWPGLTSTAGWFNSSGVTLPSTRGAYKLQATVNATYIGVLTFQLFIGPRPLTADFTFSPTSPVVGDTVAFSAIANGGTPPYSYSWNFGDGSTGTGNSISHTYNTPGAKDVTLTVTDSVVPTPDTLNVVHTVTVSPPQVDFTFSPSSPTVDEQVTFTATVNGGTPPYSFSWNFGDGSTGNDNSVIHTYTSTGTLTVTVTVTDTNLAGNTVSHEVTVVPRQPLSGNFTFSPAAPKDDSPVTFSATASGGKFPYVFSWSFGDQTTGTGSSTSHSFALKGNYSVVLTVTDTNGANVAVAHTVSVHYELSLSITTSRTQLTAGSQLTITTDVTPAKPGVTVTILYRQAGDPSWTNLGTVVTDAQGKATYTWTPLEGLYEVSASIGGSLTSPAQSNREQVFVNPGPNQTLWFVLAGVAGAVVAIAALVLFMRRRHARKLGPSPSKSPIKPTS